MEEEKYVEGFTLKVVIITIITGVVLAPAMIWASFAGIGTFGIAAAFMAMVLFGELTRLFGTGLTPQELATIRWSCSMAVMSLAGYGLLYNMYLRNSPITQSMGLTAKIPNWVAPPQDSIAILTKTLIHRDFALPLLLSLLGAVFGFMVQFGI